MALRPVSPARGESDMGRLVAAVRRMVEAVEDRARRNMVAVLLLSKNPQDSIDILDEDS